MSRRDVVKGIGAAAVAGAGASSLDAKRPAAEKNSVAALLDSEDATGLAALVRAKKVAAAELLEAAISRAEALNPRYNFLAQKLYEYGRARAGSTPIDGVFAGVPWLIKDLNTHIKGERTGQGSRSYDNYRAEVTSELVRRHERAGLVIFGKTTTPEFGLTGTTESVAYGATRNPWDETRTSGGSSGGASAAVAAGVVPMAHATDGGGSIRIPASCCGLFGLKPSRGRVPMGPPRTEGWAGLSAHHAITRSVRDSAALLDATAGVEPGSRYGAPTLHRSFLEAMHRKGEPFKIALMTNAPAGTPVDPECVKAAQDTARLCETLGHKVVEAAPKIDIAAMSFAQFVAIASNVAADVEDRAKLTGIDPTTVLEPITLGFVEMGKKFTARDFARANSAMQKIAIDVATFMADYDIILSPTLGQLPVKLGTINLSPPVSFEEWGRLASTFSPFTALFNITGQPSASLPLGQSRSGLPVGSMITARYGEESSLFRLAAQLEEAAPWFDKIAPMRRLEQRK